MPSYYGSGSSYYAPKKSGGGILSKVFGAPAGFVGNLADDVKDAVVGIPAGLVQLVRDPLETAAAVGGATWQTWSPLFSGDIGKFAKQTYDHPLAPILDVMSVFSLGVGAASRVASVTAPSSRLAKLREPGAVRMLADPTDKGRAGQPYFLSDRPARRLVQEMKLALEPHLPAVYGRMMHRVRYERLFAADMAHRSAAKTVMLLNALEAGRLLSDDPLAPRWRAEIMAHQWLNLARHNKAYAPNEAARLVKTGHYTFITDPASIDRGYARRLRKIRRKEAEWERKRAATAELANSVAKIEKELAEANRELERMYAEGYVVAMPAGKRSVPTPRQAMEQLAGPLDDATRRVADLEKLLDRARTAEKIHNQAVHNLDWIMRQRMDMESRSFKEFFAHASPSPEAFEQAAKNFEHWATTVDIRRAARTKDGRIYVAPKHDAMMLGLEARNSHAFVRAVWHNPTKLWKVLMIGMTPRSFTNNFVGGWAIHALREGPSPEAAQAVWDAIKITKGEREAATAFKAAMPFKKDHWFYRYFADEMSDVFGHELLEDAATAKSRAARFAKAGIYPFVHKFADQPVRVAAIYSYLRKHPEINRAMKEQKLDFDRAARQVLRKNRSVRDGAAVHARRTAGDYVTLHKFEQPIRDIVPFYLWYRHILRTSWNATLDTPGRMSVLSRISNQGVETVEELLGEVPEFLEGVVPLSLLGLDDPKGNRRDILLTASLNPFASLSELADLFRGLTVGGGERGLGGAVTGVNPFLTATIEAVSGKSLLTGGKTQTHGGLLSTILVNTARGLPHARIAEALASEDTTVSPAGNELMFARDDRGPITSLFGIPLRDLSLEAAERMARLRR